jgi:PAN domain
MSSSANVGSTERFSHKVALVVIGAIAGFLANIGVEMFKGKPEVPRPSVPPETVERVLQEFGTLSANRKDLTTSECRQLMQDALASNARPSTPKQADSPSARPQKPNRSDSLAPESANFQPGNYTDPYIRSVPVSSPDECAQLCISESNCVVASYADSTAVSPYSNTCTLRISALHPLQGQQGLYSWVRKR